MIGFHLRHRAPSQRAGRWLTILGVFFLALFSAIIAYPMLQEQGQHGNP